MTTDLHGMASTTASGGAAPGTAAAAYGDVAGLHGATMGGGAMGGGSQHAGFSIPAAGVITGSHGSKTAMGSQGVASALGTSGNLPRAALDNDPPGSRPMHDTGYSRAQPGVSWTGLGHDAYSPKETRRHDSNYGAWSAGAPSNAAAAGMPSTRTTPSSWRPSVAGCMNQEGGSRTSMGGAHACHHCQNKPKEPEAITSYSNPPWGQHVHTKPPESYTGGNLGGAMGYCPHGGRMAAGGGPPSAPAFAQQPQVGMAMGTPMRHDDKPSTGIHPPGYMSSMPAGDAFGAGGMAGGTSGMAGVGGMAGAGGMGGAAGMGGTGGMAGTGGMGGLPGSGGMGGIGGMPGAGGMGGMPGDGGMGGMPGAGGMGGASGMGGTGGMTGADGMGGAGDLGGASSAAAPGTADGTGGMTGASGRGAGSQNIDTDRYKASHPGSLPHPATPLTGVGSSTERAKGWGAGGYAGTMGYHALPSTAHDALAAQAASQSARVANEYAPHHTDFTAPPFNAPEPTYMASSMSTSPGAEMREPQIGSSSLPNIPSSAANNPSMADMTGTSSALKPGNDYMSSQATGYPCPMGMPFIHRDIPSSRMPLHFLSHYPTSDYNYQTTYRASYKPMSSNRRLSMDAYRGYKGNYDRNLSTYTGEATGYAGGGGLSSATGMGESQRSDNMPTSDRMDTRSPMPMPQGMGTNQSLPPGMPQGSSGDMNRNIPSGSFQPSLPEINQSMSPGVSQVMNPEMNRDMSWGMAQGLAPGLSQGMSPGTTREAMSNMRGAVAPSMTPDMSAGLGDSYGSRYASGGGVTSSQSPGGMYSSLYANAHGMPGGGAFPRDAAGQYSSWANSPGMSETRA